MTWLLLCLPFVGWGFWTDPIETLVILAVLTATVALLTMVEGSERQIP